MKAGRRLALDVSLAALAAVVATPAAAWLLPAVPAHRILVRLLLAGVVFAVLARRRLYLGESWLEAGLGRRPGATDEIAFGFSAGAAVLGLLLVWMVAAGALVETAPRPGAVVGALGTAVAVAVVEEVLFRGAAFSAWGAAGSSAVYAAVHFLRPDVRRFADGLDPFLGLRVLGDLLAPLASVEWLGGAVGLFLLGAVLCRARAATGGLYLGIGIHAGGVFMLRLVGAFTDHAPGGPAWLFGTSYPRPLSGPAGWLGIAVLWGAVLLYVRRRQR